MNLRKQVRRQLAIWLQKRSPYHVETRFTQKNLYILPTRLGWVFLFMVFILFIAASNFENSLIYVLSFWLLSLFILNFLFTHRNLSGVVLQVERLQNGFVEGAIGADIAVSSDEIKSRHSIRLRCADEAANSFRVIDVAANQRPLVHFSWTALHRGFQPIAPIVMSSTFPLGLAQVWGYAHLTAVPLAYPKPIQANWTATQSAHPDVGDNDHYIQTGSTDFYALREFQPGDSYKHIHWPSFTKSPVPLVKTFVDYKGEDAWLRWSAFDGMAVEARLCHLSYLITMMEEAQRPYGVEMPTGSLEPGVGRSQREQSLSLLALYGQSEPGGHHGVED